MRCHRFLLVLLLIPPTLSATPPVWEVDAVHSRVLVAVDHAGFSQSLAIVPVTGGVLHYDPDAPASAQVSVALAPARLDLGDARWNAAVHGSGLLDSARHPQSHFSSQQVIVQDDGQLQVHGQLELRGVRAPVVLQVTRNGQRRHPLPPFRQTVGFSATAAFSRAAFGADAWPAMVGDTVSVRIELEATRRRGHAAGRTTPQADQLPAAANQARTAPEENGQSSSRPAASASTGTRTP